MGCVGRVRRKSWRERGMRVRKKRRRSRAAACALHWRRGAWRMGGAVEQKASRKGAVDWQKERKEMGSQACDVLQRGQKKS